MTPQDFVHRWGASKLKERSGSQTHFNDVCRLIGHPIPIEVDPKGEFFTFEAGASKQTGGQGWADVWKRDFFAWEYKGKHADLDAAYRQLLQYREALENPPLLVVSDMQRIVIHTNFTNTVKQVYTLELDDLLTPAGRETLRAVFNDPERLRAKKTTAHVTAEAAAQFARLAENFRYYKEEPEPTAHFLIRLFFCLFAEDIGLLPNSLFTQLLQRVKVHAELTERLRDLFGKMVAGGWFGSERIPHVDGGLFDDDFVLPMDSFTVDVLLKVSRLDWSNIEPSILGTLFERSLDPGKRAQLGAHYTSKEDILLIVEPVLMAPLRRRWDGVRAKAEALSAAGDRAGVQALLEGFSEELAGVRILDPASGSGNFLYVSLHELLNLEKKAITMAQDLGTGGFRPRVSPAQLHGIEINAYAHELAQATVWVGYIQWLHENGFGMPDEPILKPLGTIVQMDAILAYDKEGRPVEPEWPKADVIIGNPPFLGGKRLRTELGSAYVDGLFALYDSRVPREADLVCYWFERAATQIQKGELQRAGLLATQGIRGGANRRVLERIKEVGDIFWAEADRDWVLDGAVVHVSMVGFDGGEETSRVLNGQPVETVNADLTSGMDLTAARRLDENAGLSFMGVTPAGPFYVEGDLARRWLNFGGNPHGRPNSDVVRPYYNGIDLNQRRRDVWIIDFDEMEFEEAAQYEAPFRFVEEHVYPVRQKNNRAAYRERWWLPAESRPAMRAALRPLARYIGTALVAKHRFFQWVDPSVVPANLVIVIARDDDYFFGVLSSKLHVIWTRGQGTQLREAESGSRYTATTTFETFPFPWPPGQEPQDDPRVVAVAGAVRELNEKREAWLNPEGTTESELKKHTLTNLYNERPTWLQLAHERLDRAVLDAYGWPHGLTDGEILERLLELNLERAKRQEEGG